MLNFENQGSPRCPMITSGRRRAHLSSVVMRYANPLSVVCPSCGKEGGYAPGDLVALRSRCQHCSSSLESIGLEMRADLSSWSGYLAKMDLTIELERVFKIEITDADLELMKTPLDVLQFYQARSNAAASKDLEREALAWLTRVRSTTATPADLQLDFTELFSVKEHP